MENRKSELQHPCDNKQGQADEIHWQRVVRTQEIKGREREKPEKEKRKKNVRIKRENIEQFENDEESSWKETYTRNRSGRSEKMDKKSQFIQIT